MSGLRFALLLLIMRRIRILITGSLLVWCLGVGAGAKQPRQESKLPNIVPPRTRSACTAGSLLASPLKNTHNTDPSRA